MSYKLVIFDCDGTLVNTIDDVVDCFNEALEECGFPRRSFDDVSALIGKTREDIISGLLPESQVTSENVLRVSKTYTAVYASCPLDHTGPYPGMGELVDELIARGITVAVNSNKPQVALERLMAGLFPGIDLEVRGYVEGAPTKPDPDGSFDLMRQADAAVGETLYVGDTVVDVDTAAAAGVDCALVTWGQGRDGILEDKRVCAVARDVDGLATLVLGGE